jgi:hypothetical protein
MTAQRKQALERRVEDTAARVAAAVREAAPEARVSIDGSDVRIEARGLAADTRLRWIAGLIR